MSDSFTEVTSRSWFQRIGSSVGGVVFGLLLILAMIVGLFWNEGRAVQTARSLAEGAGIVVSVPSDAVDPANEGRLVHVSAAATSDESLADFDFGIRANGIRLERTVEMFQWKESSKSETRTKLGGGEETVTTYTYSRDWSDGPVNSGSFKQPQGHSNPAMEFQGRDFQISAAGFGAFRLDGRVLSMVGNAEDVAVPPQLLSDVRQAYKGDRQVAITGGRIYLGQNPTAPQIGDYRIAYKAVPLGPLSVVGRQQGSGFAPYQTEAGDALLMVDTGTVPPETMFEDAVTGNTVLTWILRIVGLVLLMVGFALIMGPLGVIADVIPFLGRIVRMGTGAIAFVLAIVTGSIVIAVAWFWYRPLLALAVLVGGAAIVWLVGRMGRARQVRPDPAPAAH